MKRSIKTLALSLLALAALGAPRIARAQGYAHATLHSFGGTNRPGPYTNADGANPKAGLARDNSGNLFGTTNSGGTGGINGDGTVYEIPAGATTATTLHLFAGTDGGGSVAGVILDSQGDIFGTTTFGGPGGAGTVFELVKTGTGYTFRTLYSFTNQTARQSANTDGGTPLAGVVLDGQGDVFGTTYYGGANGNGVVFEIVKTGTGYATTVPTIHSFTALDANGFNADGANPAADLAFDGSGNLLGTASAGGTSGNGTVFKFAAGTNAFSTVHSFTGTGGDGSDPEGGVIFDGSGNLFGTTQSGGTAGFGAVYEIAGGTTTTTLYSFGVGSGSAPYPLGTLARDSSGSLYGTTSRGGANDRGTVFNLTKNGAAYSFSLLHDFTNPDAAGINGSNADGGTPNSVILDNSGNVLGTAREGGANGDGTVFRIAAGTTTLTTLYSFSSLTGATGTGTDGANPQAGLLRDAQGNLYGTTTNGGTSGNGTVFKIAAGTTAPVTLHSFSALTSSVSSGSGVNADGAQPFAALTIDAQGNLFGTTEHGGANGFGSVFEIAAANTMLSTLYSFTGFKGVANPGAQNPEAGVTLDGSGNLFGTTYQGGTGNVGTVFELVKGNNYAFVSVHSFTGGFDAGANTDGAYPQAALALDSSGNLFGTTAYGGTRGQGTVFKITAGTNALSTVHSFAGGTGDGTNPNGVVLDTQGNLFGTTFGGGTGAKGVVYELIKTGTSYAATSTLLYTFTGAGTDGANPNGLAFDAGGSLFGTTLNGGASGQGTVFDLVKTGATYATTVPTLYSFTGTTIPSTNADGAQPLGGVVLDTQGNLFGMTQTGGTTARGTVFELSPALTRSAHTYVSNSGVDTGPCSRSAPCRRFDYAITRTLPGGTITALNAGDFGSIFIQQAVTIDGEGTQASVVAGLSHTSSAITISAAAGDAVILRGLTLNGAGGGSNLLGVSFQAGGSLVVDHCAFSGFGGAGLDLETGLATVLHTTFTQCATGVQISGGLVSLRDVTVQGGRSGIVNNAGLTDIKDSLITQNSQFGVVANNGSVSVSGCTLAGNGVAAQSAPNATLRLTDNNLWNNGTGLNASGGIISTTGNNRRAGNANTATPIAPTDQPNRQIAVQ